MSKVNWGIESRQVESSVKSTAQSNEANLTLLSSRLGRQANCSVKSFAIMNQTKDMYFDCSELTRLFFWTNYDSVDCVYISASPIATVRISQNQNSLSKTSLNYNWGLAQLTCKRWLLSRQFWFQERLRLGISIFSMSVLKIKRKTKLSYQITQL